MRTTYVVHIVGGGLGLLAGYLALYSAKGGALHRRSGMVFVYAMLAMCLGGLTISIVRNVAEGINVPAALITAYLVVTALAAVRPSLASDRRLTVALMMVAIGVGVTTLTLGFEAVSNGGKRQGMPAFPFFMFGVVATLAVIGDLRVLNGGALVGARRVARHLWRVSFALLIAAMSFFLGQAQVIPKPIRIFPLLAVPVVLVLVTMLYWLWRVRGNWGQTFKASPERRRGRSIATQWNDPAGVQRMP